jgi:AcrR family transcriptional regulator
MRPTNRGSRPGYNLASTRPPRADAVANRARILAAAGEAFDREGTAVSLDEIARRAGLGPGTLHRHFPTKAALIDATLAERVRELAATVEQLTHAENPTTALFQALTTIVERGAASHALAERLRSESGDIDAAVAQPAAELRADLARLLDRAQQAGTVHPYLDPGGLDALIAAAHTLKTHPTGNDELVELLWHALRTGN